MQKAASENVNACHVAAGRGERNIRDVFLVRRGPVRSLVAGGLFLIAIIGLGTAIMVNNFRERTLDNTRRELENTVLLLARHLDAQLADWQILHQDIIAYVRDRDISSPEEFTQIMSAPNAQLLLETKASATAFVGNVSIVDATGQMINSTVKWSVADVSMADTDYFKTFASGSSSPSVIIQGARGKLSKKWVVLIARKITSAQGKFLGAIVRSVEATHIEKFLESLELGRNATISVFHVDGTMLARYPHVEATIGKNFSHGPLMSQILPFSNHGSMRVISPVDREDRVGAIRRLDDFPLAVIATMTVDSTLANWAEQTKFLVVIAGLLSLVIAALLYLVVQRLSEQHKAQQQQLSQEKQRLDTAINNMKHGLLFFDPDSRLMIFNERYVEMFNVPPGRMKIGSVLRDIIVTRKEAGSFGGDIDAYCSQVANCIEGGGAFVNETPDNRTILVTVQPVAGGGWVSTHEDITERRRSEERIAYLARFDVLTGLLNRISFHEQLEKTLADMGPGDRLAVLYIDLDQFKEVNDTLGHHVGDEFLKCVASRLRECVGNSGFVARLGGDEFAIVKTGVHHDDEVRGSLEELYTSLRTPFDCLGHRLTSDASIGVAFAPDYGSDVEKLLTDADLAMYVAKSEGKRTYRFFEPEMEVRSQRRRELETDMRQALSDGGFEIHYQPILDVRSNRICGCEALLRWRHPQRGMISPVEFIPIAEEAGLIDQLGMWVLTTACAEAVKWPDSVNLAVNVSPLQFNQPTFALKVAGALAATGLAPSRLELEITEAVLIRDDEAALEVLHHLRTLGVRIALDDFGTGYSSLSYLQRFPFDKIKIDRCFINGVNDGDASSSIVQAIVHIATARHIATVAEGVETKEQLAVLCDLGCDQIQGYLFSRPRPVEGLADYLDAQLLEAEPASGMKAY